MPTWEGLIVPLFTSVSAGFRPCPLTARLLWLVLETKRCDSGMFSTRVARIKNQTLHWIWPHTCADPTPLSSWCWGRGEGPHVPLYRFHCSCWSFPCSNLTDSISFISMILSFFPHFLVCMCLFHVLHKSYFLQYCVLVCLWNLFPSEWRYTESKGGTQMI